MVAGHLHEKNGYFYSRRADLLKKAGLPHVRFHVLRHSCVGLMMAN